MLKRLFCFCVLLSLLNVQAGYGFEVAPFLPRPLPVAPESVFRLPVIPPVQPGPKVEIEQFNQAVGLNNAGIDALNAGNHSKAVTLFSDAIRINPDEVSMWKNLLVALKQANVATSRIIPVAHHIIAVSPDDFHAFYAVGYALSEKDHQYQQAIPYLKKAREIDPGKIPAGIALAQTLMKAGYSEDARGVLEDLLPQVTDDSFPAYLLAGIYLDRLQFDRAEELAARFLTYDQDGSLHELAARCRFFLGKLDGLEAFCRQILSRFPGVINRAALEKILFAISPKRVWFSERVTASIGRHDQLKKLHFQVQVPPTIPGKQTVTLVSAYIQAKGKTVAVTPVEEQGRKVFLCPPELFSAEIILELKYEIHVQSARGALSLPETDAPVDLTGLREQPFLSLADPRIKTLADAVARLPGEYLSNAFLAVGRGLTYRENSVMQSAAWALENPERCDCTEFSVLLAALYVSRDIPTRISTGFLLKPEEVGKPTEIGHAWCQVNMDSRGWVNIDPTLGRSSYFSGFGNSPADQIIFTNFHRPQDSRLRVDIVSTTDAVAIKLATRYIYHL
jgi:tetratricopeptide (TPR) repeat protein